VKCVLHVTWAVNARARELEDARQAEGRQDWRVSDADDPALLEAARQAPDAEVMTEGKAVCLPCFVLGRL
jgi:hypothetical protein